MTFNRLSRDLVFQAGFIGALTVPPLVATPPTCGASIALSG
jgi:hypothetical protein